MFEAGDKVSHFKFGDGEVVEIDADKNIIRVDFVRYGIKALAMQYTQLEKTLSELYPSEKTTYQQSNDGWPENTFFFESSETQHFMGDHWSPFAENQVDVLGDLPDKLGESLRASGYGTFYSSPLKLPENWSTGFQLNFPDHKLGLSVVIETVQDGNNVRSIFPFATFGTQATLELERVNAWASGLDAQIEAAWGDASITFFDTRYIHDRAWYVTGRLYEFVLTGIAYNAKPAEKHVIKIKHPPEVIQKMIDLGEIETANDLSDEFDASQASVLLPIVEWDRDDYQFQGKIKKVVTFEDFLGQSGWLATVTVMKTLSDDLDQDLKIVITQRAWQAEIPPEVDTFIQGALWLQGYLWDVHNKERF